MPRALTLEAGGLATRTRIDGSGGVSSNPLVAEDATSEIYSVYAGPSLDITASAVVGYNRIEASDAIVTEDGDPRDVFDESVSYSGQVRAGVQPGEGLPIGVGIGAG